MKKSIALLFIYLFSIYIDFALGKSNALLFIYLFSRCIDFVVEESKTKTKIFMIFPLATPVKNNTEGTDVQQRFRNVGKS